MLRRKRCSLAVAALAAAAVFANGESARADDTIKHPGDHPDYHVEIEPHGLLGWTGFYGGTGFGAGARFTIPIVKNGFIPNINNNVGIGFGFDFVHYSNCYYDYGYNNGCGANYLQFPIVMQWNFFVAERWSVAGEPGIAIYHGFFDDYCNDPFFRGRNCNSLTTTGVVPAFYILGRYHFNEKVSLTMRVGYPTISIGASFFL